ncbi:MAG: hypothetical protein IKM27_00505 [Clostridia bacterium]|nr:hypothetical protein [Clostridia bacterium]
MLKRCALFITAIIISVFLVACQDDPNTVPSSTDIGDGVVLYQASFEEGTKVIAEILTDGAIYERAQNAVRSEAARFTVFEITATKENVAVQPDGDATIGFPIPDGYSNNLALYYVSEDGAKEALTVTVDYENKVVTAKLSHFSTYVLVDMGDQSDSTHTHSFGEWNTDSDSHWKECGCGQKDSEAAHSFGEWIVTKEPTESDAGSEHRTCSQCGYEETRVVSDTSHTHSFGEWTVTKEATATTEGSRYRICSECEYKEVETIPETTHTHSFGEWKSDSHNHWKECSCGQKDGNTAHSFGKWTITKEATASAAGSQYRTCSVCNYTETEAIPVLSHTHTFNRTSAGLKKGKCDICGANMPIYNLGGEIYDRPGENLWLVVNGNGSYDWYYEADSETVIEDYCNAGFANNYSSYRYPVMEVNVFDGISVHRYVLMFYVENGVLKHIVPSDPNWNGVIPDNVVDPKEIFCSDGDLRDTYEKTAWTDYVIVKGTTTLGGRTEEYTVKLSMHTPRSKSFWEINRSGPTFYTYYETSYSAPFQKVDSASNKVIYNAGGDYYTISAYTEKTYQAPDIYDLYYYQNDGLLKTLAESYSPMYYLYADMTCEKINSLNAPLSKEIYQGLPYGLDFTLMSDDPNEVVTYKFVVDHPDFRNVTEVYKTVCTKHELYLVKNGSTGGYTLTDVHP